MPILVNQTAPRHISDSTLPGSIPHTIKLLVIPGIVQDHFNKHCQKFPVMVQQLAGIGSQCAAPCIGEEDGLAVWMWGVPCHPVTAPGRTPRQFQFIDVDKAKRSISVAPVIVVPGLITAPEGREQEGMNFHPKSLLESAGYWHLLQYANC